MSRTKLTAAMVAIAIGTMAGWGAWAAQSTPEPGESGPSQREIDSPPSDRLRGDFGRPLQKRILPQRKKREDKPAAEQPADFPAFVVETEPKLGDVDVDAAAVKEIRVKFSKPMMDKSWSWTQGNVYSNPEATGAPHYLADKRTCVLPVKLQPGKTYVVGINGGRFNNFKDAAGHPSLAYTIGFRTRPGK